MIMKNLPKQVKDSFKLSFCLVSGVSILLSLLGTSMKDILPLDSVQPEFLSTVMRFFVLLFVYLAVVCGIWFCIEKKYENSIALNIGGNRVTIRLGDIFKQKAWRVIGMDTHFDTTVDDIVISKNSLHGQLVLKHGNTESIKIAVQKEAQRRHILPDENGRYTFPLGTVIPYNGKDGHYIMVALTELNDDNEAHTRMPKYENTLMNIWHELSRVYAKHDLALPILGSGITRFDDTKVEEADLIRCMLCTLNTCNVQFKSNISIVIYGGKSTDGNKLNKLPLYEYKDIFNIIR